MTDWKAQISYNYNPSYHAYAYGLVYQPGPEQNHGNLTGWGDAGVADLSHYNTAGVTQAYYTNRTQEVEVVVEESPPRSPEQLAAVNHHVAYQSSSVVYLGDSQQAGRLLLAEPQREHEARRAGSDSTSDSEAHTSPDSWSSGSSRETSLPQTDPATWAKRELEDETTARSPVCEVVSSSRMEEQPGIFAVNGSEGVDKTTSLQVPLPAPAKTASTTAVNNPKVKVRAAFSESQMNALVQRFSVQRYLTPAEMKNLAELTGLTYKQVKTWFQNRRMKLRRHQKDTSWVSERYNKGSPIPGPMYANVPSHIPPYQGEARPQIKEHYNQHMMDTFKKNPQNMAFYLAAMGSAAGAPGYPSWSSGSAQTAMTSRPQAAGWSMPPGVGHYEYNPHAFNPTSVASASNTGQDMSFNGKDERGAPSTAAAP
ncbi:homeobox protein NANOG [Sebastes fasciatus]|uniref:homeobox protein NANOG n=1 Tax=Sebastes fasciatus TaxID=394691 RepID=UPI003D9E9A09